MSQWLYFALSFYVYVDISVSCPVGYILCAQEGDICNNTGMIAFGMHHAMNPGTSAWYYKPIETSPFTCQKSTFGVDPATWWYKGCCYQNPEHNALPTSIFCILV
eukprot:289319_1